MECSLNHIFPLICFLYTTKIFALYQLSGDPSTVVVGDDVTMVLTCIVDDDFKYIRWRQYNVSSDISIAEVKNDCHVIAGDSFNANNGYNYSCDVVKRQYFLSIFVKNLSEVKGNYAWSCNPLFGDASNKWSPSVLVPVKYLAITPVGVNSVINVNDGDSLAFMCTTDSGRPAAWIQWYIGGQNVTNQATSAITPDGNRFIASSTLNYTWKDADHNKVVHCEAINIEGRELVKSAEKIIYLQIPASAVTISPTGINDKICIEINYSQSFTCEVDSSRPAALIEWYFGEQNVTNSANTKIIPVGSKFISYSTLNYTGSDVDHNQMIHCVAINVAGMKADSRNKTIYINIPVTTVLIMPVGKNNVISVGIGIKQTFTCTTDSSRPAALLHWYFGRQNVTNNAKTMTFQNGTKFISSSTLNFTIQDTDHNKLVYCEAINIEGKHNRISVYKKLFAIVNPFLDPNRKTPNMVTVRENEQLNITIYFFANPMPAVAWFLEECNSGENKSLAGAVTVLISDLLYSSSFIKPTVFLSDLGHYTMVATNGFEIKLVQRVLVIVTRKENTKPLKAESEMSFEAGFGSGVASVIFLFVVARLVVFIVKRRQQIKATDKSNAYEQTSNKKSPGNLYNELHDTSSSITFSANTKGNNEYEDIGTNAPEISSLDCMTQPPEVNGETSDKIDATYMNMAI